MISVGNHLSEHKNPLDYKSPPGRFNQCYQQACLLPTPVTLQLILPMSACVEEEYNVNIVWYKIQGCTVIFKG